MNIFSNSTTPLFVEQTKIKRALTESNAAPKMTGWQYLPNYLTITFKCLCLFCFITKRFLDGHIRPSAYTHPINELHNLQPPHREGSHILTKPMIGSQGVSAMK